MADGVTPMMLLRRKTTTTMMTMMATTRILEKEGVANLAFKTPSNSNPPSNNLACGPLDVAEVYPLFGQIGVALDPFPHQDHRLRF